MGFIDFGFVLSFAFDGWFFPMFIAAVEGCCWWSRWMTGLITNKLLYCELFSNFVIFEIKFITFLKKFENHNLIQISSFQGSHPQQTPFTEQPFIPLHFCMYLVMKNFCALFWTVKIDNSIKKFLYYWNPSRYVWRSFTTLFAENHFLLPTRAQLRLILSGEKSFNCCSMIFLAPPAPLTLQPSSNHTSCCCLRIPIFTCCFFPQCWRKIMREEVEKKGWRFDEMRTGGGKLDGWWDGAARRKFYKIKF